MTYLCAMQPLYHIHRFHLRERRYVRPDYARAFRLWYGRNRHDWLLPGLTRDQESLIYAWEQRRCDRRHPNRILHRTDVMHDVRHDSAQPRSGEVVVNPSRSAAECGVSASLHYRASERRCRALSSITPKSSCPSCSPVLLFPPENCADSNLNAPACLTILYLLYLNEVIMPQPADIAIITAHVRDVRAFCRLLRPRGFRFHICSLRNPRHLLGRTCPLAAILDAHLAPPSRPIPGRYDWTDDRFDTALLTLLPMVDDGPLSCLIIAGDTGRPTTFTKHLHTHPEYTLPSNPSDLKDPIDPIYPEFSGSSCPPALLYLYENHYDSLIFDPSVFLPYTARARPA